MSKKNPSKKDALEALDFIINVLKEHEKDLDRLISELGNITEQASNTGDLSSKIDTVDHRLHTLQEEVSKLIEYLSAPRAKTKYARNTPVTVKCKNWEDFKSLASEAETVSYQYKEAEKTFQADALKDGRVLTYNGELPLHTSLLKTWLSKELCVQANDIFEGVLAVG